ncbi:cephalosporin hydroxylase family protein [Stutzerimonas kunmingensis]|uniref:cephalosporin hydroxylase family protein n=1 Tax=Stutzerimonas kunmingensis TaxID=1211807 RepID=UPI0028B19786|nr:cephalosporin hydroxylase family protein [Stutzerimonas kunmingensis]
MNPIDDFKKQVSKNIDALGKDKDVQALSRIWSRESNKHGYTYNFSWLGRPIIQYPQDILAMQELIWRIQPDLIIETGIAHGGSLIFSASMLELNASCGGPQNAEVLGIDIDIRAHNREAIEAHPMFRRISMIQGSSIDEAIIAQVKAKAMGKDKVLIILDSNHTHDHVLAELEAYAPLTSIGSYCLVFDTLVEDMPEDMFGDRPWRPGNSPKTAVWEYLRRLEDAKAMDSSGLAVNFEVDTSIEHKLLITVAPNGYLRRI